MASLSTRCFEPVLPVLLLVSAKVGAGGKRVGWRMRVVRPGVVFFGGEGVWSKRAWCLSIKRVACCTIVVGARRVEGDGT